MLIPIIGPMAMKPHQQRRASARIKKQMERRLLYKNNARLMMLT
jgi:hypothetical protein